MWNQALEVWDNVYVQNQQINDDRPQEILSSAQIHAVIEGEVKLLVIIPQDQADNNHYRFSHNAWIEAECGLQDHCPAQHFRVKT